MVDGQTVNSRGQDFQTEQEHATEGLPKRLIAKSPISGAMPDNRCERKRPNEPENKDGNAKASKPCATLSIASVNVTPAPARRPSSAHPQP